MRRRLLLAILALVAGTLLVAGIGGFALIRRASATTAEQQLYSEARALADYPRPRSLRNDIRAVKYIGQYSALRVVGLGSRGGFAPGLPAVLGGLDLQPRVLLDGEPVAGQIGNRVYVLIPLQLTRAEKRLFAPPVPSEDTAVLVATRRVTLLVGGLDYFLLVGLACLVAAGAVAYWLARRFSRPLVTAAEATERIAGGDLATRMPLSAHDMPEFASLAGAINTMGDRLSAAREQQRQFLLSVSHDLRTPLTSIRGYADAVSEGATDDVAGAIAVIGSEARRLERLVQDLLDLARLDARRFSFRPVPLDAAAVASRAVDRLRPDPGAGVRLELALPTAAPLPLVADGDRLDQILANLVENACRFARSRVTVGARSQDGQVLLWVDDDGPGIPGADLARVFAPHFTSDRSGTRRTGTGLGLAIVAELAAAMGGGTRAESPLAGGEGTRMVVWLPAPGPMRP